MGKGGKNRGGNKQHQPQSQVQWVYVPAGGKANGGKGGKGKGKNSRGRQAQVVGRNVQKQGSKKVFPNVGYQKVQYTYVVQAKKHSQGRGVVKQPQKKLKGNKLVAAKPKANAMDDKMREKLTAIGSEMKVWVGGLAKDYTWKKLDKFFAESGYKPALTHVFPKGTACVCMKSEEDVANAISVLNGSALDGKTLEVDVWTQKEKTERTPGATKSRRGGKKKQAAVQAVNKAVIKTSFLKKGKAKAKAKAKLSPADEKMKEKLNAVDSSQKAWVGGLSDDVTWKQLKTHFTESGCKPTLVHVPRKGTGILTFDTADEVNGAIAVLNGSKVGGKGKDIEVDVWTKPEKRDRKKKEDA